MNLLQPPTDSLYKFVAISGLLLFGFFQVFPILQLRELRDKRIELKGEADVLTVEQTYLTEQMQGELTRLTNTLQRVEEQIGQQSLWKADKGYIAFVISRYNDANQKLDRNQEQARQLAMKDAQIKTKDELLREVNSDISFMRLLFTINSLLSVVWITLGFYMWYSRIQGPQDQILARQAIGETQTNKKAQFLFE